MTDRASRLRFVVSSFALSCALSMSIAIGCSSDAKQDSKSPSGLDAGNCSASPVERSPFGDGSAHCPDPAPSGPAFFPCDIGAILKAKCQRCHTSKDVMDQCSKPTPASGTTPEIPASCLAAPFPLLQWSDTRQPLPGTTIRPIDLLKETISGDLMPPQAPSLQPPIQALTAEEKKTLLQWVAACGPSSAKACECPTP